MIYHIDFSTETVKVRSQDFILTKNKRIFRATFSKYDLTVLGKAVIT